MSLEDPYLILETHFIRPSKNASGPNAEPFANAATEASIPKSELSPDNGDEIVRFPNVVPICGASKFLPILSIDKPNCTISVFVASI